MITRNISLPSATLTVDQVRVMVDDVLSVVPESWFDETFLTDLPFDDAEREKLREEYESQFTQYREVTYASEIRMEKLEYSLKTSDFDDFLKQPALPPTLDNFSFSAVSPVKGDAKSVHLQVRRKSANLKVTAQDHDWIDTVRGKVGRVVNANLNPPKYRLLAKHADVAGFLMLLPFYALLVAFLVLRGPSLGLDSSQIGIFAIFAVFAVIYLGSGLGEGYLRQPYWRILMKGARAEGSFALFVIGLTAGLVANAAFLILNRLI